MKIKIEVSGPHYHPGLDFNKEVTKKRDLSVPPNWVANERIEKDGISYAIVMPKRDEELYEILQEPHIHLPQYLEVKVKDKMIRVKVKVEPYQFEPKIHLDKETSQNLSIISGDKGIMI